VTQNSLTSYLAHVLLIPV